MPPYGPRRNKGPVSGTHTHVTALRPTLTPHLNLHVNLHATHTSTCTMEQYLRRVKRCLCADCVELLFPKSEFLAKFRQKRAGESQTPKPLGSIMARTWRRSTRRFASRVCESLMPTEPRAARKLTVAMTVRTLLDYRNLNNCNVLLRTLPPPLSPENQEFERDSQRFCESPGQFARTALRKGREKVLLVSKFEKISSISLFVNVAVPFRDDRNSRLWSL